MTGDGTAGAIRRRFSAGSALRDTFRVFARGAPVYLLLTVAVWLPYFMWLCYKLLPVYAKISHPLLAIILAALEPSAVSLLAQSLVLPAAAAAISGEPFGAVSTGKRILSRFLPQLAISAWTIAVVALIFGGASIALTQIWWSGFKYGLEIPLILAAMLVAVLLLRWSLVFPLCVYEGRGLLGSLRGSAELTRNARWSLFAGLIALHGGCNVLQLWLVEAASAGGWLVLLTTMVVCAAVHSALAAIFLAVSYRDLRGGPSAPRNI